MRYVSETLRRQVYERAEGRCEYCLIHNKDTYMPHEVHHIYAVKHGGQSILENLCLSCYECNRYKGSDLTSLDPATYEIVRLFHPRQDRGEDHFRFKDVIVVPLTP